MRVGVWTAATASASTLAFASPDCDQEPPSWLTKTPLSVPAAMRVRENAKVRTIRPSRPFAADQVAPPSLLTSPPLPRVPARTNPGVDRLNMMVVVTALPLCTDVHVEPPLVLLSREPSELPAIST